MIKINELSAIKEITNYLPPVVKITNLKTPKITLEGGEKKDFVLTIFSADGKVTKTINGYLPEKKKEFSLDVKIKGVCFYQLNLGGKIYKGKIVIP
jgi:hypothetical protein